MQATWQPHEQHGTLTTQSNLPDTVFAFPMQRKEPLTDATHVRNAVARFDQVTDVSEEDRAAAFANIEKAAQHYNVNLSETSWHDLGVHPQRHRLWARIYATRRPQSVFAPIAPARAVITTRVSAPTAPVRQLPKLLAPCIFQELPAPGANTQRPPAW